MSNDLNRIDVKKKVNKIELRLPLPISVNKMYINSGKGGRRLSRDAENYTIRARALANLFVDEQKWVKPELGKWLYMDLYFYFPNKRIRDSHNYIKLLLDSLEGILYTNDYYVMPRINLVELDKDNPHVLVVLTEQTVSERQKCLQSL